MPRNGSPKVLHVVGMLDRWSVEAWLLRLLAHARSRGEALDWSFYCVFGLPGSRDDDAHALGAGVIHSPVPIGEKIAFARALRRELERGRYDVLHCHHDLISGVYLAASVGLPIGARLVHVHNLDESVLTPNPLKQSVLRPTLRRTCFSLADKIIANSDHALEAFLAGRRRDPARHVVHPIGLDPGPFATAKSDRAAFRRDLGLAPETPILLFAGRMTPEKNPVFAVDVLAALRRRAPDAVAVFAGDGDLADAVRERAAALGQSDADAADRLAGRRRQGDERQRLVHPAPPARADGGVRRRGGRGAARGLAAAALARRLRRADPARRGLAAAFAGRRRRRLGGRRRGTLGRAGAVAGSGAGRFPRLADGPRSRARPPDGPARPGRGITGRMNAPATRLQSPRAVDAPATQLKVLQLIDGLGMGGAETWLMELVRYWRAEGRPITTHFLATGGRPALFDDEARALGASIFYLRYGRRDLLSFTAGFRRILRSGRYDALHDHQDYASGWHYLMGLGALPPVRVTHVHNPAYQILSNYGVTPGRRLAARAGKQLAARYATHIAGTSRAAIAAYGFDAPAFASLPKAALYCGFDPGRFLASPAARASVRGEFGWPTDSAVVLFAGRFDVSPDPAHPQAHKNAGFAVDVAIAAARASGGVRFIFAGPFSAATPILRARIEAAGFGDRIAFAGVRKDIERLMAGADALLFPSRAEGLGMVAVEAQAAGLPVLASTEVPRECVVIPDLVRFDSLGDGPAAWSARLLAALGRPRMDPTAANDRVAVSPFAIAHSAAALERLYRDGVLA